MRFLHTRFFTARLVYQEATQDGDTWATPRIDKPNRSAGLYPGAVGVTAKKGRIVTGHSLRNVSACIIMRYVILKNPLSQRMKGERAGSHLAFHAKILGTGTSRFARLSQSRFFAACSVTEYSPLPTHGGGID